MKKSKHILSLLCLSTFLMFFGCSRIGTQNEVQNIDATHWGNMYVHLVAQGDGDVYFCVIRNIKYRPAIGTEEDSFEVIDDIEFELFRATGNRFENVEPLSTDIMLIYTVEDGLVYYANKADNDFLYVANSDFSTTKKLLEQDCIDLIVQDETIFYTGRYGDLWRMSTDGENKQLLLEAQSSVIHGFGANLFLYEDFLYYVSYLPNASGIYKIPLDGGEPEQVFRDEEGPPIRRFFIAADVIYFLRNDYRHRAILQSYDLNSVEMATLCEREN